MTRISFLNVNPGSYNIGDSIVWTGTQWSNQQMAQVVAQLSASTSAGTTLQGASFTPSTAIGMYIVVATVNVVTSGTAAGTVTCTYTDERNATPTLTFNQSKSGTVTAAGAIAATGQFYSAANLIRARSATAISIQTGGTWVGATYDFHSVIIELSST